MTKTIIFCADGTWGSAEGALLSAEIPLNNVGGQSKNTLTNVSMLFQSLLGKNTTPNGVKVMEWSTDSKTTPAQIAMYVHGVGDDEESSEKIVDGMFGIGVTTRIANGYNYISKNYKAGDQIVLVGFSRGAYTVRALAGLIASEGLLKPEFAIENTDANDKFNNAVKAWVRYRKKTHTGIIDNIVSIFDKLTHYRHWFESSDQLDDSAFIEVDEIAAVAVWDTVGAMGMPLYHLDGEKYDLFNFANTQLSAKVIVGLHAVAIDEPRTAFQPTLWDEPAKNVKQQLFAGVHTDIGGGNEDHQLSDVALGWFFEELKDVGVQFQAETFDSYAPDACGKGHLESLEKFHVLDLCEARKFPSNMAIHATVGVRKNGGPVFSGYGEDAKYDPSNLPELVVN